MVAKTGQESLWSEEGNGQDVEMAEDIQPEDPGRVDW